MRMDSGEIVITGLGSVSPFGAVQGLIGPRAMHPRLITRWPTRGDRRAFLVEPFRPEDVVRGLKTRRLDRLSVWCLVAAALAMRDARLNLDAEDCLRIAVVFGTGFGCLELTEACMQSIAENACGKSDPVVFPETLSNAPASHVARTFGVEGPNITVSSKGTSAETALLVACSLLGGGEADIVLVISGDTLARTAYEWYEAASVLSSACFLDTPVYEPFSPECDGFVPGEGVAAAVLERDRRCAERGARIYASIRSAVLGRDASATSTSWGSDSQPLLHVAAKALGGTDCPAFVVACANGSPALDRMEAEAIRGLGRGTDSVFAPKALIGEFDGNALLRIVLTLSHPAASGGVLVLGAAAGGDRAAVTLEIA